MTHISIYPDRRNIYLYSVKSRESCSMILVPFSVWGVLSFLCTAVVSFRRQELQNRPGSYATWSWLYPRRTTDWGSTSLHWSLSGMRSEYRSAQHDAVEKQRTYRETVERTKSTLEHLHPPLFIYKIFACFLPKHVDRQSIIYRCLPLRIALSVRLVWY